MQLIFWWVEHVSCCSRDDTLGSPKSAMAFWPVLGAPEAPGRGRHERCKTSVEAVCGSTPRQVL